MSSSDPPETRWVRLPARGERSSVGTPPPAKAEMKPSAPCTPPEVVPAPPRPKQRGAGTIQGHAKSPRTALVRLEGTRRRQRLAAVVLTLIAVVALLLAGVAVLL